MTYSRRQILAWGGASAFLSSCPRIVSSATDDADAMPHVATNTYPWLTFARRAKQKFELHTDQLLHDIAITGIAGYEPIITSPNELKGLKPRLEAHGLEMRSIYVNSVLHDAARVDESMAQVIAIATAARDLGTKIIVTNPSPIRWGGTDDKTDFQLKLQARSLNSIGAKLETMGMALAYHNHDAELRQGGREFHHMLTATDPENVKFCMDAHWVYRGCGNSEVAVFDSLTHYHERIVELHLRQSKGGVWTESFTMNGDINYQKLFDYLNDRSINPHLVLEQAVEAESQNQLSVIDAHRESYENVQPGVHSS